MSPTARRSDCPLVSVCPSPTNSSVVLILMSPPGATGPVRLSLNGFAHVPAAAARLTVSPRVASETPDQNPNKLCLRELD
jgi:hypothetical protein